MEKPNLVIDKENDKVFLDGEVIALISSHLIFKDNDFEIIISENKISKSPSLQLSDFYRMNVACIIVEIKDDFFSNFKWMYNTDVRFYNDRSHILSFLLNYDEWSFTFSFNFFIKKMNENFRKNESIIYSEVYLDFTMDNNITFEFRLDHALLKISEVYYKLTESFKQTIKITLLELNQTNSNQPNLINTFTFPPEIQSSCEQYLIYFATFLKDIGINADTNIESKTHETLFTVIPKNGEEALDKIKEALHVYLSLPESPEFESAISEFIDIGAQQLASQVYFLKSQLMLANSAIQMKDATIKSLNMTNYQQSILLESHQTKKENEEIIANGLVKVREVKIKGFIFDLPEILRRIKRRF